MRNRKSTKSNLKRLALTSGLAAGAGYIAGLLTAPKSGKRTRRDIKVVSDRSRAEAEKELKRLHTELSAVIKDGKTKGGKLSAKAEAELKDLVTKAGDTKEKVREVLSAIHEGDAPDQDLKRAIKNANSAVEHLRDYLKK